MGKRRGRTHQIETWVDVSLSDFSDEDILEYADEIRKEKTASRGGSGSVTGGLDHGSLTISLGSWDALKLREAMALGYAYDVMDILRRALDERVAA